MPPPPSPRALPAGPARLGWRRRRLLPARSAEAGAWRAKASAEASASRLLTLAPSPPPQQPEPRGGGHRWADLRGEEAGGAWIDEDEAGRGGGGSSSGEQGREPHATCWCHAPPLHCGCPTPCETVASAGSADSHTPFPDWTWIMEMLHAWFNLYIMKQFFELYCALTELWLSKHQQGITD